MGLDITWYTKLIADPEARFDQDGSPPDGRVNFHRNDGFPAQAEGIAENTIYSCEDCDGFRAGSYGGYNAWRNQLAKLAGWGSAEECWESDDKPGPFKELIHFSDCEGVIGPVVAKKLAKDFADFDAAAKAFKADDIRPYWFYGLYQQWRNAFEKAADNGAVDFH